MVMLIGGSYFFGRQYLKPILPDSIGNALFPTPLPPIADVAHEWIWLSPMATPPDDPLKAAKNWASEHHWEFKPCESSHKPAVSKPEDAQAATLYDDPDFIRCLSHVRKRPGSEDLDDVPGLWLPPRKFSDRARHDFEEILNRRPDFFYAAYLLGCWHRKNGDAEQAKTYFEQSYKTAPTVLVFSFDMATFPESWEPHQHVPRLIRNAVFAQNIDVTYHYGTDFSVMVRYPCPEADENGLVKIPAFADWLTWERTFYVNANKTQPAIDKPQIDKPQHRFVIDRYFRSGGKVSFVQHSEIRLSPYMTQPAKENPLFDPYWGMQQNMSFYENLAADTPPLVRRQPLSEMFQTGYWFWSCDTDHAKRTIIPRRDTGAQIAPIYVGNAGLLPYLLQEKRLTRNDIAETIRQWSDEHSPDKPIAIPDGQGAAIVVVECDGTAWLQKIEPAAHSPSPGDTLTTIRIGEIPRQR